LHHRFTQTHPFQDGNGRVARTLASLIFIRQGLFPIVITRNDRQEYINASEAADKGELTGLVNLFSRLQEKILIKGLGLRS
jgi:Fic family protein